MSVGWGQVDWQNHVPSNYTPTPPDHFTLIYSGAPYLAMNLYALGATLNGINLIAGDEIGIFDGDNCVGAGVLIEEITTYLPLVASTDDPGTSEVDGFIAGHDISFRFWDASAEIEITAVTATFASGDGTFSVGGTAMKQQKYY